MGGKGVSGGVEEIVKRGEAKKKKIVKKKNQGEKPS